MPSTPDVVSNRVCTSQLQRALLERENGFRSDGRSHFRLNSLSVKNAADEVEPIFDYRLFLRQRPRASPRCHHARRKVHGCRETYEVTRMRVRHAEMYTRCYWMHGVTRVARRTLKHSKMTKFYTNTRS